ncbi:MAG: ferritin-like domain-containing protein [Bryobacteraceae bacterium]
MSEEIIATKSDRRSFFKTAGLAGLGGAAAAMFFGGERPLRAQNAPPAGLFRFDTPGQVFTAALIAEDLATTFYYHALTGKAITDPALAGSGGTATSIGTDGNAGNVNYLQAALSEEIAHANLFRSLLNTGDASKDPAQTFYFPAGTFDTLNAVTTTLYALESAFIGAYLNAIRAFSNMAAQTGQKGVYYGLNGVNFGPDRLNYFAEVAASILGVEAEHRALGRVISNTNPANQLCYESTDGLDAVYNGPASAVAALTPFLTASSGLSYSFATALADQASVSIACSGGAPAF